MQVYHWTTKKNAKNILRCGLKVGSWICKNAKDWHGEICLEINNFLIDWTKTMYNWQATTGRWIHPKNIEIYY